VRVSITHVPALWKCLRACALVAVATGCSASAAPDVAQPDIFPAIPEIRAVRGVATVELYAVLDDRGLPTLTYEALPGVMPTIRVHPGDTIDLTLHNDMLPEGAPNLINIHFHGMQVAPVTGQDETVMTLAHRGQTLHYRVKVPAAHEPGLYWYHPHSHGESYREVTAGISGAIVVEGMQDHLPALAAMRERVIVLRDIPDGASIVDDDMPMNGLAAPHAGAPVARRVRNTTGPCRPEKQMHPTLNRQPLAHIGIAAGERQFFRVVNASGGRYFDLRDDAGPLQLVALDGVPLDAWPGNPVSRTVSHLVIPPAGRAEFVVTGSGKPALLRSACFDSGKTGDPDPSAVLASLDVVAPAGNVNASPFAVGKPLPRNFFSRPLPPPAKRRTIRFTEDSNGFYLDDKAFDMDGPPSIVARSGTVERWTLVNDTDEVHDFHIHQVHFVVDSVQGRAPAQREWLDTVNLSPRTKTDVTIDFRDPIVRGTFLYHCHILDHEDQGMMAKIKVV